MKLRGVELAAGMIITTVCKKHYVVLAEEDQNNSFVFADLGSGKYTGYLDENTITNIKDGNSNKTLWPKYREIFGIPIEYLRIKSLNLCILFIINKRSTTNIISAGRNLLNRV